MIIFRRGVVSRALLVSLALLFHIPCTAAAEQGSFWVVPGGGVVWLPNEFLVKPSRPEFGAILGARLSPKWALEAHGTYIKSPGIKPGVSSLSVSHLDGNLTWFAASDHTISPYLTAGAGFAYFHRIGASGGVNRLDFGGGLGFRLAMSERTSFRIEGRDLTYKVLIHPTGPEKYRHHPETFAGISFSFGGAPRDKDRDGVPDKVDRCPGTPAGARVDAAGCGIDSDNDGVFDGIDACGGTPEGAVVDARGCPVDSDSDGVADGLDRCADTPAGAMVDATGCPRDSDGDKVYDGIDQCPGTPKGCLVNTNGCPTDADQDGVCDGLDECPETPATAKVDRAGCPIIVSDKETQLLETGMIRLQDINFATGKAEIQPGSRAILDEVGNILARWPDLRIEIGGHTDSRGTAAKNLQLSKARAQAVLKYITEKFLELDPDQFTAVGYGASRPIADNKTELGRAKNRRVEFKVLNKDVLRREKTQQRLVPKE